ncbi:MAG TPA: hypothetical protein VF469_01015 [Kofleriaceae bacterium]
MKSSGLARGEHAERPAGAVGERPGHEQGAAATEQVEPLAVGREVLGRQGEALREAAINVTLLGLLPGLTVGKIGRLG